MHAAANAVTIPTHSSVALPVGSRIVVRQTGAGATTVVAASGVTLNGSVAGSVALGTIYQQKELLQTVEDVWTCSIPPASGMTNPMTTAGDIIIGGTSGTPARLAAGTSGYVLRANGASTQ